MTNRQQLVVVGCTLLALAAAGISVSRFLGDELEPLRVGATAPEFTAATLDTPAKAVALQQFRGEVVLLNIWATFCVPCRTEMPSIEAVHRKLGPRGLRVIAVSVDAAGSENQIRAFIQEYGLTFRVLYDSKAELGKQYQTTGVPETFVIGRDGTIRKRWIGEADWNSAENVRFLEGLLTQSSQ